MLFLTVLSFLCIFVFVPSYKYQFIDRVNPFLKKQEGYAILPKEVTYNNGQKYSINSAKNQTEKQFPDDYNVLVVDSTLKSERNYLTFSGGQSPKNKNFGRVTHKGKYVYKLEFIKWNEIPKEIQIILKSEL